MANLKKTTSSSGLLQGASQSRNGKVESAPRSFFSKRVAILFIVSAYIFLKHQHDLQGQGGEQLAKVQVPNRVARSLAKETVSQSEHEGELEDVEWEEGEDSGEYTPAGETEGEEYVEGEYEIQEEGYPDEDWEGESVQGGGEEYLEGESVLGEGEEYSEGESVQGDVYLEGSYEAQDGGYFEEESGVDVERMEEEYIVQGHDVNENLDAHYGWDLGYGAWGDLGDVYEDEDAVVEEETQEKEDYDIDDSQYKDWDTFKHALEMSWFRFEDKLNKSRSAFMKEKDKEISKWFNLIQSRWMNYSQLTSVGEDAKNILTVNANAGEGKKWFDKEVRNHMDSLFKNWMEGAYADLVNTLKNDMKRFKEKHIKGWLLHLWKQREEYVDYEALEYMTAAEFLDLVKSQGWFSQIPGIENKIKELIEWFVPKEKEYLQYEESNWAKWKKVRLGMTSWICKVLSVKRLTKEEWTQFVNENTFGSTFECENIIQEGGLELRVTRSLAELLSDGSTSTRTLKLGSPSKKCNEEISTPPHVEEVQDKQDDKEKYRKMAEESYKQKVEERYKTMMSDDMPIRVPRSRHNHKHLGLPNLSEDDLIQLLKVLPPPPEALKRRLGIVPGSSADKRFPFDSPQQMLDFLKLMNDQHNLMSGDDSCCSVGESAEEQEEQYPSIVKELISNVSNLAPVILPAIPPLLMMIIGTQKTYILLYTLSLLKDAYNFIQQRSE
ncbi:hypothetical protein AK88_04560 [Plasmodium fragile]|uniref:Tryptophan/threonine-rich plasmodium antigen C-terminal domain-containing protein n=1 Tax=Plasmodium fragile TaxID=5857 RepID=A0A0D9QJ98_PLAFR|nr:uncharacterized protein AK88_04560 [Plasmodium fragile]KJP85801.1 hypothetical protein AK88_04560 [Plasmodium fragile]